MPIIDFSGNNLLQEDAVSNITLEADLVLQKQDVAAAWQAVAHLKRELGSLAPDKVRPFLDAYRAISSKLKILALPLLGADEVQNLLEHNLQFIDRSSEPKLISGLRAWINEQPGTEQDQEKQTLLSVLPKQGEFAGRIRAALLAQEPERKDAQKTGRSTGATPAEPLPKDELLDVGEVEDVTKHAQKLAAAGPSQLALENTESLAKQLFALAPESVDKELFARRAKALIVSRLKDVRTELDLRDYLARPVAVGGLGLSGNALASALQLVQQEYTRVHQGTPPQQAPKEPKLAPKTLPPPASFVPAPREHASAPVSAPVSVVAREKSVPPAPAKTIPQPLLPNKQIPSPPVLQPDDKAKQQAKLRALIDQDSGSMMGVNALIGKKPQPQSMPQEPPAVRAPAVPAPTPPVPARRSPPMTRNIERPARSAGKPQMNDITPGVSANSLGRAASRPRAVGLAGELGSITISDFRRLGACEEARDALLQKLATLEADSVVAKITGIRQFRTSALFTQYLTIGRASLSAGRKLAEVLADPLLNPDKMTEDEFFTIAALNSKLK